VLYNCFLISFYQFSQLDVLFIFNQSFGRSSLGYNIDEVVSMRIADTDKGLYIFAKAIKFSWVVYSLAQQKAIDKRLTT